MARILTIQIPVAVCVCGTSIDLPMEDGAAVPDRCRLCEAMKVEPGRRLTLNEVHAYLQTLTAVGWTEPTEQADAGSMWVQATLGRAIMRTHTIWPARGEEMTFGHDDWTAMFCGFRFDGPFSTALRALNNYLRGEFHALVISSLNQHPMVRR